MKRQPSHHCSEKPEPKVLGIDQLGYFVGMATHMIESYCSENTKEFFWTRVRTNCPELAQALDASFTGEWDTITFTRAICSQAFACGDEESESESREGVQRDDRT